MHLEDQRSCGEASRGQMRETWRDPAPLLCRTRGLSSPPSIVLRPGNGRRASRYEERVRREDGRRGARSDRAMGSERESERERESSNAEGGWKGTAMSTRRSECCSCSRRSSEQRRQRFGKSCGLRVPGRLLLVSIDRRRSNEGRLSQS